MFINSYWLYFILLVVKSDEVVKTLIYIDDSRKATPIY